MLALLVEETYRDRLASDRAVEARGGSRELEEQLAEELADAFPAKTADFTTVGEGRKDDVDKVRMELVPPEMVFAVAEVLTFGAAKYDARNWEKGMSWGRVFGALMRHLWAWWGGKGPTTRSFLFGDLDGETGYSHLWHAGCCIAFLIAYEERGSGTDDRFKAPASPGTSG